MHKHFIAIVLTVTAPVAALTVTIPATNSSSDPAAAAPASICDFLPKWPGCPRV